MSTERTEAFVLSFLAGQLKEKELFEVNNEDEGKGIKQGTP